MVSIRYIYRNEKVWLECRHCRHDSKNSKLRFHCRKVGIILRAYLWQLTNCKKSVDMILRTNKMLLFLLLISSPNSYETLTAYVYRKQLIKYFAYYEFHSAWIWQKLGQLCNIRFNGGSDSFKYLCYQLSHGKIYLLGDHPYITSAKGLGGWV